VLRSALDLPILRAGNAGGGGSGLMNAKQPPIREETRNRCVIVPLNDALSQRLAPISLEHFHFLHDVQKIDFSIFVVVENWLIEFIKPKEFSKELLDEIWMACLKPKGSFRVCLWKQDKPKFEAVINQVRSKKLARLMAYVPHMDKKTVDLYNNLSASSQLVVNGGIDEEVVARVRASASLLVSSVIDSQAALFTLSKMISCDPTLYDHSASVAMLCAIIAQEMVDKPMSDKEVMMVAECGLFHDAGKTCVPSEVLNKPGKLTPEEFDEIKKHTVYGRDELTKSKDGGAPIDDQIIRVAYEHHEKFNGRGYPEGRSGRLESDAEKGIHLYSRICMIADVYSALLMKRVYKEAFEPGQALKIMIESNEDYDPVVFKPFVSMVVDSVKKFQNMPAPQSTLNYSNDVKGKIIQLDGNKSLAEAMKGNSSDRDKETSPAPVRKGA
jgi:HD-GYP domain-containing protein (c-di-GMP phosphodiesterase class II)